MRRATAVEVTAWADPLAVDPDLGPAGDRHQGQVRGGGEVELQPLAARVDRWLAGRAMGECQGPRRNAEVEPQDAAQSGLGAHVALPIGGMGHALGAQSLAFAQQPQANAQVIALGVGLDAPQMQVVRRDGGCPVGRLPVNVLVRRYNPQQLIIGGRDRLLNLNGLTGSPSGAAVRPFVSTSPDDQPKQDRSPYADHHRRPSARN